MSDVRDKTPASPEELDRRTRTSLEWPELCSALAAAASFSENRTVLRELTTEDCETPERRNRMFDLTAEMLKVLDAGLDHFHFSDFEVAETLASLRLGRTLTPMELLNARKILEFSRQARGFVTGREAHDRSRTSPELALLVETLCPDAKLTERLVRSVDDEARILSTASEELASARHALTLAERRLVTDLERLLKSQSIREALQDPIWMERDGHYVLPVRTDRKSAVEGTTISVSQSGSTLFIEPTGLAQSKAALEAAKRDEHVALNRVLRELSAECRRLQDALTTCSETLLTLDRIGARARLAKRLGAVRPELHTDKRRPFLSVEGARHPLFVLEDKPCIPHRFGFGEDAEREKNGHPPCVLVLSGPNAGGKTVTMKTFGLFVLMAQSGLFVPADRAVLFDFGTLYAAIGDSQSRQEDLSTFSAHLLALREIMQRATPQSLILLDEGFVGTDPAMGAALARSVLESLAERNICTIITTHFSLLKTIADENPAFLNASMEFEQTEIRPTYRLLEGIPGQSYALELASRMGFAPEILERARVLHGKEAGRLERLLHELQLARNQAEEERRQQQAIRVELEAMQQTLAKNTDLLQSLRADLGSQYEHKLQRRLNAFRNALEIKERQFERRKERLFAELEAQERAARLERSAQNAPEALASAETSEAAAQASAHPQGPKGKTPAQPARTSGPTSASAPRPASMKDFASLARLAEERGFGSVKVKGKSHQHTQQQKQQPQRKWLQGSQWLTRDNDFDDDLGDFDDDQELRDWATEEALSGEGLFEKAAKIGTALSQEFKDLESEFSDDLEAALALTGFSPAESTSKNPSTGKSHTPSNSQSKSHSQPNSHSKMTPPKGQTSNADPRSAESKARDLFQPGAKVKSPQFKETGEVTEAMNSKGLVMCRFGSIKTRIPAAQLTLIQAAPRASAHSPVPPSAMGLRRSPRSSGGRGAPGGNKAILDPLLPPVHVFASRTIDLRGSEVDVALEKLDRFIDKVIREEMPSFVILHGHGMGAVKAAIRGFLKDWDLPCRYRPGTSGEGGDGVTVVVLT